MDSNRAIVSGMQSFLNTCITKKEFRTSNSHFSRSSFLCFKHTVLFLLSIPKNTLSISGYDFIEQLLGKGLTMPFSKSSFSKARYKVSHRFFRAWNNHFIALYENYCKLKKWKGLRLYGIDGSTLILPNRASIIKSYGSHRNQNAHTPMARVISCYDVLNHVSIRNCIVPIKISERNVVYRWMRRLPKAGLYILDRGFCGFPLFWLMDYFGYHYLVRSKVNESKAVIKFMKSGKSSAYLTLKSNSKSVKTINGLGLGVNIHSGQGIKVRMVKVILEDGTPEVLITNLMDQKRFTTKSFKELYFQRWRVEVFFDQLKNHLQLELFTGRKPLAVEQEFHAAIFMLNLQSVLITSCDRVIKQQSTSRKYEHKINRNVTFGLLKRNFVLLMTLREESQMIHMLKALFVKHTVPIKPNRNYVRKSARKRSRKRHYTDANYARAT